MLTGISFQFSLWDSLFCLLAILSISSKLSILFMRFTYYNVYNHFIPKSFQFSLWDSHFLPNYAWIILILSILFMRFVIHLLSQRYLFFCSFNSLYEIHCDYTIFHYIPNALSILFMRFPPVCFSALFSVIPA